MPKNKEIPRIDLEIDSHSVLFFLVRRFFSFNAEWENVNSWFKDTDMLEDLTSGQSFEDPGNGTINSSVHTVLYHLDNCGILVDKGPRTNHGGKDKNSIYAFNRVYWEPVKQFFIGPYPKKTVEATLYLLEKYNSYRNSDKKWYMEKKKQKAILNEGGCSSFVG